MSQNFTHALEAHMEKFREDRVHSGYYDDDAKRIDVYFDNELLGYVEASLEDERVNIYSIIDGKTTKLDDDSLNVNDIEDSVMAQGAYADSLIFDDHLAQWIREKSYELR